MSLVFKPVFKTTVEIGLRAYLVVILSLSCLYSPVERPASAAARSCLAENREQTTANRSTISLLIRKANLTQFFDGPIAYVPVGSQSLLIREANLTAARNDR